MIWGTLSFGQLQLFFFLGHQTSSASFLVAMSSAVFPQRPTEEELFVGPGISLSLWVLEERW